MSASARAKIEGLTNAWYGFSVFTAAASLLSRGIGVFSVLAAAAGLLLSWFVTYLIGRALLGRSSAMRLFLLLVSGLCTVLGVLGVGKLALVFVTTWDLRMLLGVLGGTVCTWMYGRSFGTLVAADVRAYFR